MPHRLDRLEPGGADGGIGAEHDADDSAISSATPSEIAVTAGWNCASVSERTTGANVKTPARPASTPSTLPNPEMAIDSVRNCTAMSRLRAPAALRIPISLVRCTIETSSTFMTPMPPTTIEMPVIAPMINLKRRMARRVCSTRDSFVTMVKDDERAPN